MRRTSSQMYPLLEEYEKSGMSKKEFCDHHGLNIATFWYWYSKYRKSRSGKFLEVEQIGIRESQTVDLELGRAKMTFRGLPPIEYLRSLCLDD